MVLSRHLFLDSESDLHQKKSRVALNPSIKICSTQKRDIENANTDIESDDVGAYRTPVALQKKKKLAPIIKSSEGEHSESEIEKMDRKKRNKGQQDNATQVRQDQYD